MAAAIDATVGGTDANSYVAEAEFTAWAETRQPSTSYDDATADERIRALVSATRRLDQEKWKGVKNAGTQALQWPRYGVVDPDAGYDVLDAAVLESSVWYDTDVVPERVKDAQMELAYQFLAGNQSPDPTGLEGFEKVRVGALDVTPRAAFKAGKLTEDVVRFIRPLLRAGGNGVRLLRG